MRRVVITGLGAVTPLGIGCSTRNVLGVLDRVLTCSQALVFSGRDCLKGGVVSFRWTRKALSSQLYQVGLADWCLKGRKAMENGVQESI